MLRFIRKVVEEPRRGVAGGYSKSLGGIQMLKLFRKKEVEVEPRIHDIVTIHFEGSEGLDGLVIAILEVVEGKLYQVLRDDGKSLWLRPEELEVKQNERH